MKNALIFYSLIISFLIFNNKSRFYFADKLTNTSYLERKQPPFFKISITRKAEGTNCIVGDLAINDKAVCHTLELPFIDNIDTISTLPAGLYSAKIRTDNGRGWRIELEDVPSRKNIQIHIGNYTSQIYGCTLVGTAVSINMCTISKSRDAMKTIEAEFLRFKTELCLDCLSSSQHEILVEYKKQY